MAVYVDESKSYKLLGDAVLMQPGALAYQIFDQSVMDTSSDTAPLFKFKEALALGRLLSEPALETLACRVGLDPATLVATVARYNGFVRAGRDEDFGRSGLSSGYGKLLELKRGPWYAYPSTSGLIHVSANGRGVRSLEVTNKVLAARFKIHMNIGVERDFKELRQAGTAIFRGVRACHEVCLTQRTEMRSNPQAARTFKLKKWLAATVLAAFFHAGMVDAAGLGRLNVLSRLGQPFAAEIELINVTRVELATLNVSLAPVAAYQAANLLFDPALNALRLSVERYDNGTPYIRATSARRVTEPYLDLLIVLTWQDGKVQRTYAALLDLPGVAEPARAAPAPAAAVPASKAEAVPPRAPRAPRVRKPSVVADATPASAPVVPAPAPATARTPVTPSEAGKNGVVPPEPGVVASAKPELVEPAAPKPEPAGADLRKEEPLKSESNAPDGVLAAESPSSAPKHAPPPPGVIDTAMDNIVLIGGIALALLACIVGLWALRRRKPVPVQANAPIAPTVAIETVDTDAFAAGATAPEKITTPNVRAANIITDVDAIYEANVYLEHGQDAPAEKVLRDALSRQPGREDIQLLILEILSGRGDKDGFNQLAGRLHKQTGGVGEQWKRAMAMGYALDPSYPLYSPTDEGVAYEALGLAVSAVDIDLSSPALSYDVNGTADTALDRGVAGGGEDETKVRAPAGVESAAAAPEPLPYIAFELPPSTAPAPDDSPVKTAAAPVATGDLGLDFKVDFSSLTPARKDELAATAATAAAATDANDSHAEEVQEKIVLARAYREMGDQEGALELLREAEREGDAAQQAEARELLQTLA